MSVWTQKERWRYVPASLAPTIRTCAYFTCSRYVAVVIPRGWNPTHDLTPPAKRAEAIQKLKEFLEKKVKERLGEREMRWSAPECYCVYADSCKVLEVWLPEELFAGIWKEAKK